MASNTLSLDGYSTSAHGNNTSDKLLGENPNQYSGSKALMEAKAVEEGMYFRIDMPGVEKDDVEVWIEEKTVFFIGEAKKQWEHDSGGRIYGGNIDLSSDDSGEVTEVKTDVQNGVLRMILVGCRIKPDLSAITTPSSSTKTSDNIQYKFHLIGDHLLKNRIFSLFNPPGLTQSYTLTNASQMLYLSNCPKGTSPGEHADMNMRCCTVLNFPKEKFQGYYPFQVEGAGGAYEATIIDNEKMFKRLDMPDVSKEEMVVQFRDNLVLYGGTGINGSVHDGEKRRYFGKLELKCDCCKYVNVKSEMKAGVLRMLITKKSK
ncbi:hypothetical protein LguiB_028695 [Lonicera macranthoides]